MADYRDFYRELRTDWLKLRGYLFDPVTQLPALPTVVDDVRRRLEAGERIGLIYVDPSSGGHLEANWGWQAYDDLIREVAKALRASRSTHLEERDTLALVGVRGDEFVIFAGLDGHSDSRERLEDLRAALHTELLDILETRPALEAHHVPRFQSAAVELALDPTVRIERSLYASLQEARQRCREESRRRHSSRLRELRRILEQGHLAIRYQPILDLANGRIFGVEALSAPPTTDVFEGPEMLFAFAEESGHILELERLCRRQALERVAPILGPDGRLGQGRLFLNCSAHGFSDPDLMGDLLAGAGALGIPPDDVVLEVTERVAITEWQDFRRALGDIRATGLRVAIDDMGSGYSSLRAVAEIEPDFLKFDLSLIHDLHRSPIKRDMVETLVVLAAKIGARPVAEGIERIEEYETLRRMGIELGQGYLFAHPAAPDQFGEIHFPALHDPLSA